MKGPPTPSRLDIAETLGQFLRGCRERQASFNITDIAERIECSVNYWGLVELGKRLPSIALLERLGPIIGLSKDEMLRARMLRAASRSDDPMIRGDILARLTAEGVGSLPRRVAVRGRPWDRRRGERRSQTPSGGEQ